MRILLLGTLFLTLPLHSQEKAATRLPDHDEGYQHVERFIQVLEQVRTHHPDADKLTYERLVNHALEGMLGSLDPFSAFYHPETAAHLDLDKPDLEPQFTLPGLGLTLGKKDGQLFLANVRPGSTAERAGLRTHDDLLKLDNHDLSPLDLPEALAALSGTPGETLSLTVYRKSARREITAEVLRAVIKQAAVADSFLLTNKGAPNTGYIRLTEFTAVAASELEAALDDLEDQGMKSLILDLRGNPGGLLHIAVEILGLFLPPDTRVVSTRGRSEQARTEPLRTPARQRVKREYPLAVLLDRNSASASELVAGALQDLQRAVIVGEQSFGKGSVQSIRPQGYGTALRLTFATYHTPSGKTPHLVGITPDVAVKISEEDQINFEHFKTRNDATASIQAQLENWQDPCLKAALEAL